MSDKKTANNIVNLQKLKNLIDTKKSRQVIADEIGCDVSLITKHYNGQKIVTIDYLKKYAEYFGVSADYLIDLSEAKTTDKDLQYICDYTGLNEDTINSIIYAPLLSTMPTNPDDLALLLKNKRIDNRNNAHNVINSILSNTDFHNIIAIMLILQEKNKLLNEELTYIEQHKSNYDLNNDDYLLYDKLNVLTPDNEEDLKRASVILNNQINVMRSYNDCLSLINEIKAYNYDIRNSFENLFASIDELPNDRLLDIQSMYLAVSTDYNKSKDDYDMNITLKNC